MRPAQETIDISRDLVTLLPRLRRFALALTRHAAEADMLVETVCERAMGRQTVWNGRGRLEDTLYVLARTLHEERQAGRRAQHQMESPGDSASRAGSADPVQKAILSMPAGLAGAFLLVAVEKQSYHDAGHILGIGADTVAQRLVAARRHLATLASSLAERRA